ncbi:arf-GAP with coiled-coil, ANK repeat and PH domain-containing protein 1 [Eurytemora carolleeae]|uniref:arf-GAP with coiled-coil, ANK repeat and PH domain-containing protein 1 n=1 Tax=Eurytemora carolleeae TaxID=1294199 RepID=UPI000C768C3E|nr:arf-GAP with coiled-coil, ANK repeat and PH domain-containing protein 1 [Eurytemora carolleeae]|eukprot:XP_023330565.1 arf-GAP with coiled-coil, ANK repeat and PH domain-containing protein 1-like [Eurytemora affinis]
MPAPVIDYIECLKDSPRFRQQLNNNENSLDELETKMEKLLKSCNTMTESGRNYISNQAMFIASLWELSSYFSADQETTTTSFLNKLIQTLQEALKFQNVIIDQTNSAINKSLSKFLKEDMKKMRETKGYFNKISNDLDSALNKNSAASKGRTTDLEDTSNLLTATRSCFRYTGMDYVYQISMLQSQKRYIILDSLGNLVSTYKTFFRQGLDLFGGMDPFLKSLNSEIESMKAQTRALEKNLEKRHTYVTKDDDLVLAETKGKPINVEGYLFKRGQNAFRTWNRRWFYLDSNKLCYVKRNGEEITVMEDDLRICMVRPLNEIDRRFCFEVISPTKSHVLQADSEILYRLWMSSLQQGISSALHEAMSPEVVANVSGAIQWEDSDTEEAQDSKLRQKPTSQRNANQILDIPGNEVCCDCSDPKPQWAATNFGITLCIECCGIHRSLGVHITKVKSITLDAWEPEILKVMAELGNSIANRILENQVGDHIKPGPGATRPQREAWITLKYKEKAFVNKDIFKGKEVEDSEGWIVNKLRRRTRIKKEKTEKATEKEKRTSDEKDVDTSAADEDEPSLLESVLRASTLTSNSKESTPSGSTVSLVKRRILNTEVVLFGGSLGKHHVASVELDSDQESTDGESETSWNPPVDSVANLTPELLLFRAARAHNLPVMLEALALGANMDWKYRGELMQAPIHQAVLSGSVMSTEFLILNGAKTGAADGDGNTPLHLAALHGNTGQVCLLLKHRADHHLVNNSGHEPLDIGVTNSDADIVTLLRLAALNEEIRENDFTGDDDTFNDVVQEFSQMVYTHPERLNRNKK